jgi:hypothetical protein
MDFQLEYIGYRSQGNDGQLSQAQSTSRVNSNLQSHYLQLIIYQNEKCFERTFYGGMNSTFYIRYTFPLIHEVFQVNEQK